MLNRLILNKFCLGATLFDRPIILDDRRLNQLVYLLIFARFINILAVLHELVLLKAPL